MIIFGGFGMLSSLLFFLMEIEIPLKIIQHIKFLMKLLLNMFKRIGKNLWTFLKHNFTLKCSCP